jgi:hypothetical protein
VPEADPPRKPCRGVIAGHHLAPDIVGPQPLKGECEKRLADLVWTQFPGPIRGLLDNKFLYRDFWNAHNGRLPPEAWKPRFEATKAHTNKALGRGDTLAVLGITLDRIYTLRNQLVHGGSTWNGTVNREQVRDCARFMAALVPVIIEIMMDHPRTVWSGAVYPVVAD